MSLIDIEYAQIGNPVDAIEQFAERNDWIFDRSGDDEITISMAGNYADYHVSFTWLEEMQGLHLACAFDFRVNDRRRGEVLELLARINERLWLGHFDIWAKEGMLMFRQTLLLGSGMDVNPAQVERMVTTAVETTERYFPAFQFVVWAGKSADEAIDAVILDTVGEA
ncbi:MAG: YbjN domain-containing protein [Pseudomonadota bacterium]